MIYILPRYLLQGNLIILIYLYKYWYIENTEVFQFFNSNNIIPLFIAHHWVLIQKSVVCLYCCFQLANCILPGLPSGVRRWEAPFHPRRRVMSQGAREPWGNSRQVPPLRTISLHPASQSANSQLELSGRNTIYCNLWLFSPSAKQARASRSYNKAGNFYLVNWTSPAPDQLIRDFW